MFITDALSLSHVPRWCVVRMSRSQSVAEHSFAVAMIAQELMTRNPTIVDHDRPIVRHDNVIWHALTHDIDECVTGDIPGNAKQYMKYAGETPDLVPDRPPIGVTLTEIKLVKLADVIEAYTYCGMHGAGLHAIKVAQEYLRPMLDRVANDAYVCGLVGEGEVDQLVLDISAEKGRRYD